MFLSNSKPHLSDNIFLRGLKAILFLTIEGATGDQQFSFGARPPPPPIKTRIEIFVYSR